MIFEKGDRVGTKYSPRNLCIRTFSLNSYIFTRGGKNIYRKIFPHLLNHFLNKEASPSTKLLVFNQYFSHLAFLIDLKNEAHNLNIYINTWRRILHLPLTLHHGVGHCKRDITSWKANYSFSLIQTHQGGGWITDFTGCFYHITVGYMFGSIWEEIPCKGQRWIALTSFSEPSFNYTET